MAEESKILIIGGTGYMGKHLVEASVRLGHPTFALVRERTLASDPEKAKLIEAFRNSGVVLLYGDLYDQERLVEAIKKVDVVISALGHESPKKLADQVNIISAIKQAGTIKRFFPSEFGLDVGRIELMEPAKTQLGVKAQIREAIKEAGIPYTIVSSNLGGAYYFLRRIGQIEPMEPPTDKILVLGDGNSKVIFVGEEDVATYTIKAADDPRTLNKILYIRPPANIYSHNQLISLWERKSGKTFERIHVSEEEIFRKIQESPPPLNFGYAIAHAAFVKGETTNFEIDPLIGVEASELCPDVKYTTVDEFVDRYI
ncbi:isoflavone reductase-like protein [Phoenix dactylifera]|uniref:Isoflavone reductase-like protein n=1 Tax=Phoenix dactylifera TaxID=42345 RepID=A0A8B7BZH7_PHODC|nr:isoflavone reductase-like protein [Phoenix dactylifera]